MNPDLQSARRYYDTLPPHVKARQTAKHLLAAIQIAEQREVAGQMCSNLCFNLSQNGEIRADYRHSMKEAYMAWDAALARVSKPEDK